MGLYGYETNLKRMGLKGEFQVESSRFQVWEEMP